MVGLVKDSDAPARKPFQWNGTFNQTSGVGGSFKVTTVPPNQRLVIEQVSGNCNFSGVISVSTSQPGFGPTNWQWLPANFLTGAYSPLQHLFGST